MLTSIKNPLIKEIRKLHNAKERHKQNLFLIEGKNSLEVVSQINYPLKTLITTSQWQQENNNLWQSLTRLALKVETVAPEILKFIATTVNPDGVLAIASRDNWRKKMPESIKLGLILESIQDPGNLGTIIRTAVATNVDCLWLSNDSVDFDHPKVMRASAGEWFKINMINSDDLLTVVKFYQNQGMQIIATLPTATKTYWQLDFTLPSLILFGNESKGLSSSLNQIADQKVTIPLLNEVESLNVAIANSLLLYERQRQLMVK